MSLLARAAMAYARMGIGVFPLVPRQKRPIVVNGFKEATCDLGRIEAWWRNRADANVGIATGGKGGFWVLDLDGPEAEDDLAALVAVNGALPATVEQATGKGRHLCFAWTPGLQIRNSASRLGRGIDVRGEGGYIVAPPSVHPGDEKKGIPPGRIYAWTPGRSPRDLAFAVAPDWLVRLALPQEAPAPARPATPRVVRDGQASRYGEACLRTACRMIATAPLGRRQSSIWGYACFVGGLVSGGEIQADYARSSLIHAAMNMGSGYVPFKEAARNVDRGLKHGGNHPRTAPERRAFAPAERGARPAHDAATPAQAAAQVLGARDLWDAGVDLDRGLVRWWFERQGLDMAALPGAAERLRAAPAAPLGAGRTGAALLIPLVRAPDDHEWRDPVDALAVVPLTREARGVTNLVGDVAGKVGLLTPWPDDGALLVATDLADAWALGANAHENDHALGVVLAPTLRAFAGRPLGDKYGRVDPRTPHPDPEDPPWVAPGERAVFLAVRGDLRSPQLPTRRTFGGTEPVALEGEAAARFYAGLAEQAWRRAGANQIRILRPSDGVGFHSSPDPRGAVSRDVGEGARDAR